MIVFFADIAFWISVTTFFLIKLLDGVFIFSSALIWGAMICFFVHMSLFLIIPWFSPHYKSKYGEPFRAVMFIVFFNAASWGYLLKQYLPNLFFEGDNWFLVKKTVRE